MGINLKERKFTTLVLVVIVGILIGGYLNTLVSSIIPGKKNVVKTFFTTNIKFGIGDFGDKKVDLGVDSDKSKNYIHPLVVDLYAIKFLLGFQIKLSFLSILGLLISLYFFRWYR